MEKEIQDKARAKVIELYQERAWDSLLQYSYWGAKYEKIEKQIDEYQGRIKEFEKMIADVKALPDSHSKDNRAKVAAFQKDIDTYKNRIKSIEPVIRKLQDNAVKWQQQGVEFLELAEAAKDFKVNTPEEIAVAKQKPAPVEETAKT